MVSINLDFGIITSYKEVKEKKRNSQPQNIEIPIFSSFHEENMDNKNICTISIYIFK